MTAYCVEYVLWYKQDKEWISKTEYRYCFSLYGAQNLAETLRWNEDVVEDSVHIRLLTDREAQVVLPTI